MNAVTAFLPLSARRSDTEAQVNLSQRRAWFDGEGEITPATPDPGADTGEKDKGKSEVTFTPEQQAHIDRIARDQREQSRRAAQADMLKKFGADKAEDIEAKLKKLAELEMADMTASEKAETAKLKAEAERDQLKAELEAAKAERLADRRDRRIDELARAGGLTSPEMLLAWAEKYSADALKATTADDGTVDEKAVKTLIEAFRKVQPALFKPTSPGSPSTRDGRAVSGNRTKDIGTTFKL